MPPVLQPTAKHRSFKRGADALRLISSIGANYVFPEKVQFDKTRPTLLAANHRSLLDLPVSCAVVDHFGLSGRFLVRADLMESGLGAKLLHSIGCIPASRDTRESAEATAIETLLAGQVVGIMPEGRVTRPSERVNGVGEFKHGASRIAVASGAVVLPIAVTGSDEVWPRDKMPRMQFPRPIVEVRTGDLISFESDDHEANTRQLSEAISDMLAGR